MCSVIKEKIHRDKTKGVVLMDPEPSPQTLDTQEYTVNVNINSTIML